MYKCQAFKCKQKGGTPNTPYRQPKNSIIVEKRPKTYKRIIKKGKKRGIVEEIEGWEIAKEIAVCAICYERITGLKAARSGSSLKELMQKKERKPFIKKKRKKQNYKKGKKPSNNNYQKRNSANARKTPKKL
ncbi:hypothetical protein CMI41_01230 [Candidatus Pacearchaeota archaeon]|nr:hypothetical protein [Candidatus Pacearchaeota archaeon]|tara:strand:- start:14810 stop:15205 length:396 start_codon:yes stop_codon:yes gene_type:complete